MRLTAVKYFIILIFLTSVNSYAFFWDAKIKVNCYQGGDLVLNMEYEVKNGEVYETMIVPKRITISGKNELISLKKLEGCTIKSPKSWTCGGVALSSDYKQELHTYHEGRYTFYPGTIGDRQCSIRKQS
jgi:hypothetical protein